MWHNLRTCKVIYDKDGRLEKTKKRFDVSYPEQLRKSIIDRNMKLLHGTMPSYDGQIAKAVKRGDIVSINHRTTAFMESYFDVIFALNELTHPGEKRQIELCNKWCNILPNNFEENLERLFADLFNNYDCVSGVIKDIVMELDKVIC